MRDSTAPHIVRTAQRKETVPLDKSINLQINLFVFAEKMEMF